MKQLTRKQKQILGAFAAWVVRDHEDDWDAVVGELVKKARDIEKGGTGW